MNSYGHYSLDEENCYSITTCSINFTEEFNYDPEKLLVLKKEVILRETEIRTEFSLNLVPFQIRKHLNNDPGSQKIQTQIFVSSDPNSNKNEFCLPFNKTANYNNFIFYAKNADDSGEIKIKIFSSKILSILNF